MKCCRHIGCLHEICILALGRLEKDSVHQGGPNRLTGVKVVEAVKQQIDYVAIQTIEEAAIRGIQSSPFQFQCRFLSRWLRRTKRGLSGIPGGQIQQVQSSKITRRYVEGFA